MYPDQIYNLYSDLAFSSPQPKVRGNKSILQEEQSAGLQSLGLNDTYKQVQPMLEKREDFLFICSQALDRGDESL